MCEFMVDIIGCTSRVLELGCGVGLSASVLCRTSSPVSYVCTDVNAQVLERCRANLQRNIVRYRNPMVVSEFVLADDKQVDDRGYVRRARLSQLRRQRVYAPRRLGHCQR